MLQQKQAKVVTFAKDLLLMVFQITTEDYCLTTVMLTLLKMRKGTFIFIC